MTVVLSSILFIQPNGCFQALERPLSVSKQAVTRTDMPATGTRIEQKERTRQRICEAALSLIGQGRSFTSLSLREITREAGIVPAAFYRHFSDMDQLGLALVEMGGVTLRRLLREARRDGIPPTDMLRGSVLIYKRFVEERSLVFRFIAGERGGGSQVLRKPLRLRNGAGFTCAWDADRSFHAESADDLRFGRDHDVERCLGYSRFAQSPGAR
jgi:AcrR family transcriptional regulator